MKPGKTGIARILAAAGYSLQGIKAALNSEAAFRQECFIVAFLLPLLFFIPATLMQKVMMAAVLILVLVVELLNSAIESVVDLVSPEPHELAGRAKDMGSAAVMGALVIAIMVWAAVLIEIVAQQG